MDNNKLSKYNKVNININVIRINNGYQIMIKAKDLKLKYYE